MVAVTMPLEHAVVLLQRYADDARVPGPWVGRVMPAQQYRTPITTSRTAIRRLHDSRLGEHDESPTPRVIERGVVTFDSTTMVGFAEAARMHSLGAHHGMLLAIMLGLCLARLKPLTARTAEFHGAGLCLFVLHHARAYASVAPPVWRPRDASYGCRIIGVTASARIEEVSRSISYTSCRYHTGTARSQAASAQLSHRAFRRDAARPISRA
jgi:hypothetical protein